MRGRRLKIGDKCDGGSLASIPPKDSSWGRLAISRWKGPGKWYLPHRPSFWNQERQEHGPGNEGHILFSLEEGGDISKGRSPVNCFELLGDKFAFLPAKLSCHLLRSYSPLRRKGLCDDRWNRINRITKIYGMTPFPVGKPAGKPTVV